MESITRSRHVPPRGVIAGLMVGWLLVLIKCFTAPWVIAYWSIPIHPGWVVVPTLLLAALVTWLILAHDWSSDSD